MNNNSSIAYSSISISSISSSQNERFPVRNQSVNYSRRVAYLGLSGFFSCATVMGVAIALFSNGKFFNCIRHFDCPNFCDNNESDLANKNCTNFKQIYNPNSPAFACCETDLFDYEHNIVINFTMTILTFGVAILLGNEAISFFRKAYPTIQRLENFDEDTDLV